jgi:hypothetical protein
VDKYDAKVIAFLRLVVNDALKVAAVPAEVGEYMISNPLVEINPVPEFVMFKLCIRPVPPVYKTVAVPVAATPPVICVLVLADHVTTVVVLYPLLDAVLRTVIEEIPSPPTAPIRPVPNLLSPKNLFLIGRPILFLLYVYDSSIAYADGYRINSQLRANPIFTYFE